MAANKNKKLGELVGDPLATRGSRSVEAWFLGSRAENLEEFERLIVEAVRDHGFWRRNFHPGDPSYITEKVKRSSEYLDAVENTRDSFRELLAWLKKSVPFFSLRYQGHMTWETTIPSMLGYFSTMLYNPNNVAFEASTVTTLLEMHVGDDLCRMLGYHLPTEDEQAAGAIVPWGHITSGGTVANLEGLWAARNLKFYAFTLKHVIGTSPELKAGENIEVPLSEGNKKKLVLMTTWELLNLRADDILAIPSRLHKEYGISEAVVKKVLEETEYTVQKLGMTEFAQHFLKDIKQPVFFVPGTKHYSWPKSAAILGIGSKHMIDVAIDVDARMDLHELENHLDKCLQDHIPVFAVIAVIGSTEESSIDPLADIVTLRDRFRKRGLNFSIHADAAWGGYHACLLTRTTTKSDLHASVPVGLSTFSTKHMLALADTDSITVDPHKSGYIPYPAGAICYRNGTMRNLLTFIAPYVNTGKEQPNVGSFGVEGSKPGAAVAAVYLSHKVIRPDVTGYGQIIGRAMFGSKKLYARLLCMARPEDRFVVVPVPRLSSAIPGKEEQEKIRYVRERIDKRSNDEISQDKQALEVLKEIGPDQNILCYAFNFKNLDGTLNDNLEKANKLNELLYEILSINAGSDIYAYDLLVSTTAFEVEHYSEPFMKDYAKRMGLKYTDRKSIKVLRSTVMDPWISEAKGRPFIDIIEDEFRNALGKALSKMALLNLFQSVDTNADGRIDKSEVRKHLQHLGYSFQEIENIWKQSDSNHDDSLSSDEFIKNVASFLVTRHN